MNTLPAGRRANLESLKADVLAAVESIGVHVSVFGPEADKRSGRAHSATDIAVHVAERRAIDLPSTRQFASEASRLAGTGITVGSVKKALASLVETGEVQAYSGGDLKKCGHGYGVMETATYYTSNEGAALLEKKRLAAVTSRRESTARKEAERIVLERHADEVTAMVEYLLSLRTDQKDEG